jgi:hypothetical protein
MTLHLLLMMKCNGFTETPARNNAVMPGIYANFLSKTA